ncbi:MAG: hypothetical protein V3U54_12930 [Thermodesulfobacteriota bacterium]
MTQLENEMNTVRFDFISDLGHGYVKVPLVMIQELGITNKISEYSFKDNEFGYLEEDCDFWLFIGELLLQQVNIRVEYNYIDAGEFAPCRQLPRFT